MSARDRDPFQPEHLNQPLRDQGAWAAWLRDLEIPVLADTAATLEAMRANEDAVDANLIGELISADPLMTLKVLVHASANRPARVVTATETVTGALVMMGISPFFNAFGAQPTVEALLHERPAALGGLRELLLRARRAAHFALAFAVHRMDHHAASIHQAALQHDFAERLLWCHAPVLALRMQELQQVDPALRSNTVQRAVFNAELPALQHALMIGWRLPELLVRIADDDADAHPRSGTAVDPHSVQCVMLAVRLARHTRRGWHDAALPDDLRDIGELLNLSPPATLALLHDIDR